MAKSRAREIKYVRPQPGYQMKALSSPADIVIGGGAAGSGKTYSLLLEFLRHIDNPGFGGVIFRRTGPQIKSEGGLWDTSQQIYPFVGAIPKESYAEWHFKKGPKLKFSHLEHEKNIHDWQGAQIPFIGFDELCHFSSKMFWYLLGRNRSVCGVKPYVRATCNPDPDSWVSHLIDWWIGEDGLPISERDGVIRYLLRDGDSFIWGDSFEEVIEKGWYLLEPQVKLGGVIPKDLIKSLTFVSGSVYENKALLSVDPGYLGNLMAQDEQTKSQLLHGNWKVVLSDNDIYDYASYLGMFDNKMEADRAGKYITADIALQGSDKFVVGYWEGFNLANTVIMAKSDGPQVIETIANMAKYHGVPNKNITFDNDGIGGFVDGYIKGAIPFHNGGSPVEIKDAKGNKVKENYEHLKAQCYYRSGARCGRGEFKISEHVAHMMYDDKETMRQRFIKERKAIKRDKKDHDGKLKIIPKQQMKVILGGQSPDVMDMFMMREIFELQPKRTWAVI